MPRYSVREIQTIGAKPQKFTALKKLTVVEKSALFQKDSVNFFAKSKLNSFLQLPLSQITKIKNTLFYVMNNLQIKTIKVFKRLQFFTKDSS